MVLNLRKIDSQELMSNPERQYKFVLIYCKTGYVKIEIDNQVYEMSDRQFLTIMPKQFYQFIKIVNCKGYILHSIIKLLIIEVSRFKIAQQESQLYNRMLHSCNF